jgi:hypothetical protein
VQTGGSVQFTVTSNDIQPGEQLKLVDVTAGNSVISSGTGGVSPLKASVTSSSQGTKQYAADQLGQLSSVFKVNWVAPTLTLAIAGGSNIIIEGTTSDITATVLGVLGAPLSGVPVTFDITSPSASLAAATQATPDPAATDALGAANTPSPINADLQGLTNTLGPVNTNAQGVATASFRWRAAGRYAVTARTTVNGMQTTAASPLAITIGTIPNNFAALDIYPAYGRYHVYERIKVAATVLDGNNARVSGITVTVSVLGRCRINQRRTLLTAVSDANGVAETTFRSLDEGRITVVAAAWNNKHTRITSQPAQLRIVGHGRRKGRHGKAELDNRCVPAISCRPGAHTCHTSRPNPYPSTHTHTHTHSNNVPA